MNTLNRQTRSAGFTLLEALIYIALFGFVLGGAVVSAYQMFEGSAQIQAIAMRESEANFILRKLDWMLNASTISSPASGFTDTKLVVDKDGDTYTLAVNSDNTVTLKKNAGTPEPLTGDQLNISGLTFQHVHSASSPDVLNVAMTINTKEFEPIKKYERYDI